MLTTALKIVVGTMGFLMVVALPIMLVW